MCGFVSEVRVLLSEINKPLFVLLHSSTLVDSLGWLPARLLLVLVLLHSLASINVFPMVEMNSAFHYVFLQVLQGISSSTS